MKYYERWWQENHATRGDDLRRWLVESDTSSRAAVAEIADTLAASGRDRLTVLECGPGVYVDADTIWRDRPAVRYAAIDVTPAIVADGTAKGLDVRIGSVEAIPYPARSFDLVYCRHVLEHLPSYRQALTEMIKVASRVAVAVFWRLDTEAETDVILWNTVEDVPDTFHNMYAQKAVTAWLDSVGVAHTWRRTAQDWLLIMDKGR